MTSAPLKLAPRAAPQLQIQAKTGARLDSDNLGLLMEFVRKDPDSYREEFDEQLTHFVELGKLIQLQPAVHRMDVQPLLQLTNFLSSVAFCYPESAKHFGETVERTLRSQGAALDPDLRLGLVKAIVVLRNRGLVDVTTTLELFFELVKCEDKELRKFVMGALIAFIRQHHKKFHRPDSKFQAFVFAKSKDNRAIVARSAEVLLIDAFRRQFWRDAKTANAIAECLFNKTTKIQVTAIKFFLGPSGDEAGDSGSDSDSDSDGPEDKHKTIKEVMTAFRHAKKTKKRQKQLADAKKAIGKEKRRKKEHNRRHCNLEALRLLYDPQTLCDRLFGMLEGKKNERYTLRLLQVALIARLIGVHQLQTLGFYSYLHRYLQPKQREVTRILLYAAQACHEYVPTDIVQDLVRHIARNFVSDHNTPEAITVGLNAIREVFVNCPFAATPELVEDLAEYKSYKNKNVSMAARGLIQLFRAVNPALLRARDRGRPAGPDPTAAAPRSFGHTTALDFLPGAEVLNPDEEEMDAEEEADKDNKQRNRKAQKQQNEDSDDEWIDVDSSGSEIEIATDSEDEEDGNEAEESDDEVGDEEEEVEVDDEDEAVDDEEGEVDGDEVDSDGEEVEGEDQEEEEEESEDEPDSEAPKKKAKRSPKPKLSKVEKKKVKKLEKKLTAEAIVTKAREVSEGRILGDEDFRKIRAHQLRKQLAAANPHFSKSSVRLTNDDQLLREEVAERLAGRGAAQAQGDGLPRLNHIAHFHKKVRRQTKAERLEQIKEGRGDRDMYKKRKKNGPHVGRTNANLAKHKNFQMVRQKVRGKNRQRSFRDQQKSLRNYLLRQAGRKPE